VSASGGLKPLAPMLLDCPMPMTRISNVDPAENAKGGCQSGDDRRAAEVSGLAEPGDFGCRRHRFVISAAIVLRVILCSTGRLSTVRARPAMARSRIGVTAS